MPWSNQGGGGGPWGSGSGGKGPWGGGPQSSGPTPPDLEEMLRRGQDKLRRVLPGGNLGGKGFAILGLAAVILWGFSGVFQVGPDELGVVLRFGQDVREVQPGLNYHLPYPIETVLTPKALRVNKIISACASSTTPAAAAPRVPEESLMLTGDGNIVDVDFSVCGKSNRPRRRISVQHPESRHSESGGRAPCAKSSAVPKSSRSTGAADIETAVQDLMQKTLDHYGAGILVQQVQMQKVDPPTQVIDAFRDVQAARADLERAVNEAQTYQNRVVPEARGKVAQITQAAEAYKSQTVAEATGQTSRFLKIYEQYLKAPEVTRERMYLETMERVLGGADKIILDSGARDGGSSVVPYLPLNELARPAPPRSQPQAGARP